MKEENVKEGLRVIKETKLYSDVIYQEILTRKNIFVERYFISDKKPLLEILMFVGLNILPSTRYFGYFPFDLCKETGANVSVVYEAGCSGKMNRYFRRFTQEEAEEQYLAGFEIVKSFKGKVIIFSHSASTIEHLKLIFNDKYKNFSEGIDIVGGIISAAVTNILLELKKMWPNYDFFSWKNIMQIGRFFDFPLPVYPYYNKARHAKYSSMNNLSIWINAKTSEFLLNTNIKKIILNGKSPEYPLLVFIAKHDSLFSSKRQEALVKYMSKKSKVNLIKCDGEHNIFLSTNAWQILGEIKKYISMLNGS